MAAIYDAHDVVVTKRDTDGRAVWSISARSIHAFMIEQAQLAAGMRVLEVGSGLYRVRLHQVLQCRSPLDAFPQ